CVARSCGAHRTCQTESRSDLRTDRRIDWPRRGDRGGRWQHPFGPDGDAKADPRPRRRALSPRTQYRDRTNYRTAQNLRWHRAGGGEGLPGQRERCCRAVACRDWSGLDESGDLGRSERHAQHPPYRCRIRLRLVLDVDREYSVRKSKNRFDHRALSDRLSAEVARPAKGRDLNSPDPATAQCRNTGSAALFRRFAWLGLANGLVRAGLAQFCLASNSQDTSAVRKLDGFRNLF